MKTFTKIIFSTLLLSACSMIYADKGVNCGNCCYSCCNDCYCNGSCGSKCSCNPCECRVQSRSTFVVRPQYQVGSPEYLTAFRDRMDAKQEDGNGGSLQFTFFGGKSTKPGRLATFFTPFCKSSLVARDDESKTPLRDLDPQHFNVNLKDPEQYGPAEFESTISFCPRIKTLGLGITYRQNLSKLRDCYDPCKRHWWFEISTPLTRIETTMGLSECITTTYALEPDVIEGIDQTFYASMKAAFNQSAWKYGKINGCCECAKTRLADISVLLGWETVKCENCLLEGYLGLLIPTGNKRCATYMFEPIVGHSKHWGIIKGWHLLLDVWKDECSNREIQIAHDSNGMYLFKKDEMRSFDLKCKPWSRYMEVYKNKEQAEEARAFAVASDLEQAQYLSSPGINEFTQCLCVRPRLSFTTNTAIILTGCHFKGEVGYNLYCKQSECVELCCWNKEIALKATEGGGNTNTKLRTINEANSIFLINPTEQEIAPCDLCYEEGVNITDSVTEYEEGIIKASDLDMESATHPSYFAHTVYGSLGARWDDRCYPTFFDVGASYEFGDENVTLCRWTAWIKGGVSF